MFRCRLPQIAFLDFIPETREKDLIYWEKTSQSILESVHHTNGRFFIRNAGYYYVFSQIKYSHDPDSARNIDARQSHSLLKYSYKRGRLDKLLENSRTFSQLRSSENNGTCFIGAVFEFDENDQIMVKSTHTHMLSGDEHENFFGLYTV